MRILDVILGTTIIFNGLIGYYALDNDMNVIGFLCLMICAFSLYGIIELDQQDVYLDDIQPLNKEANIVSPAPCGQRGKGIVVNPYYKQKMPARNVNF